MGGAMYIEFKTVKVDKKGNYIFNFMVEETKEMAVVKTTLSLDPKKHGLSLDMRLGDLVDELRQMAEKIYIDED